MSALQAETLSSVDLLYLRLAEAVSRRSPDPSMKCGSVIVSAEGLVAVGWNDMPAGCISDDEVWNNRPLKYERVVHGEVNAVLNAGHDAKGATMYCWPPGIGPSCARCTAVIIQSGIRRVVFVDKGESSERWAESVQIGLGMYAESAVQVCGYSLEMYEKAVL